MPDFTIIIPHRGNSLGLWATLQSCEAELEHSRNVTYNYVVVSNGEEKLGAEAQVPLNYLRDSSRLRSHVHSVDPLTPSAARQRGVQEADGQYLCFFDNHCLVTRHYFERALLDFQNNEIDILHSSTRFYSGQFTHYEYKLLLDYNFWGSSQTLPQVSWKPYEIMAGGHGGFFVKRDVYEAIGGYGPDELLDGYGGEELIFDLKAARYGYKNYIDPKIIHYHFAGNRGYPRHYTDEYYMNMMVSALVVGGEKWFYKVAESFLTKLHIRKSPKKSMYELMIAAYERGINYSQHVDAHSKYTLDEVLAQAKARGVIV